MPATQPAGSAAVKPVSETQFSAAKPKEVEAAAGGKKKGKLTKADRDAKLDDLKKELNLDEHIIPLPELCTRFNTDTTKGMNVSTVEARLAEDGYNELTAPPTTPEWVKFLLQVRSSKH